MSGHGWFVDRGKDACYNHNSMNFKEHGYVGI